MISLNQYGFGPQFSMKIYQVYESETLQKIEENPYQLVKDVEGIGFIKADELGARTGISGNDPDRIRAALCIPLRQQACRTVIRTYKRKI